MSAQDYAAVQAVERLNLTLGNLAAQHPLTALAALHATTVRAGELISQAVKSARGQGASWDDIGQVLGVSKQAAAQRFGEKP